MRILLTNHMLDGVGGTEKWVYYMARELAKAHEVEVFTFFKGATSEKLEEFCTVRTEVGDGYDLILSNHNTCLHMAQGRGPIIHTSHGPEHNLERPMPGADAYVGVSQEVAEAYEFPMDVVTNGVDLDEFSPLHDQRSIPRVLSLCKSAGASWMLHDACKDLGFDYDWMHYTARPTWDIAKVMRGVDIVVGCGRTAIEALACGKRVLVFDGREEEPRADGWITEDNVEELRERNFSCRTNYEFWDLNRLKQALMEHTPTGWQRPWAVKNADIRMKANRYLTLREGIEGWHEDREDPARKSTTREVS